MRISMCTDFRILKRDSEGVFIPMNKSQADAVSVGGFEFCVGELSIPFDWDAFTGSEENGMFRFYTGKGFVFNDYELADYYDEQYEKMGLVREDLTAEFLASTNHIEEFSVSFQDYPPFEDEYNEVVIGCFLDNAKADADYKLELVTISFRDMETEKVYDVKSEVLEAFNKGERGLVISEKELEEMANRGDRRLRSQAKEAMADLDSKISECKAIANEQKVDSKDSIDRDAR